jgi:hypothetical protein
MLTKKFIHVQRVINSCERNLHRTLKELGVAGNAQYFAPEPALAPSIRTIQTTSQSLASFRNSPKPPIQPSLLRPPKPA